MLFAPVLTPDTISVLEMASDQRPAADVEMATDAGMAAEAAAVTAVGTAAEAAAVTAAEAVKIPFYLKAKRLLSLQIKTPAVAATT